MHACPHCCGENIKKDGVTIKGFQRFFCHFCRKYWQENYIRKKSSVIDEQKKLIEWARCHPILSQYFIAAADSDTFLLVCPNEKFHGLLLQLKIKKNVGILDKKINEIKFKKLISIGYEIKIVRGFNEALEKIENYLANKIEQHKTASV